MNARLARPLLAAILAGLLTLACAQLQPSADAVATAVAATLEAAAAQTAAAAPATPTIASEPPTATPPPAPTETPTTAAAACPPAANPPPLTAQADFAAYGPAALAYLNAGGTPAALAQALQNAGVIDSAGGAVQPADLTGDGVDEVVAVLVNPQAEFIGPIPPGQVYVYSCVDGSYVQAYDSGFLDGFSGPVIQAVEHDLTQDGRNDLLYSVSSCGASTCFDSIAVIAWNGADFADVVQGDTALAFAAISLAPGAGDGVMNIEMYGGAQGSVGAGPPRQYVNVWGWNGTAIVLQDTRLDPPVFRFHLLNDADDLALAGDHAQAIDLYSRVIHDDSLEGWEPVPDERFHLAAYAQYRVMVSRYLLGEPDNADAALVALLGMFPSGRPGGGWGPAGQAFSDSFEAEADAHAACAAVIAYLSSSPTVLEPFANFGYANRQYTPQAACPY